MSAAPAISLPLLDTLQIASPCSARWEEMSGDDRSRLCGQCSHKVHNISGMTRPEAEAFLASTMGPEVRVCVRFYRRADGTIITADCPVGLAALRAKARRALVRGAAAIGLTSLVAWAAARESRAAPFAYTQPLASIASWLRQPTSPPAPAIMGKRVNTALLGFGVVNLQPTPPSPPPPTDASTQP